MKYLILTLFTVALSKLTFAQNEVPLDVAHDGAIIYTCDTSFCDSGGDGDPLNPTFQYDQNEDLTITFCPDHPGYFIRSIFEKFDLDDGDRLEIYDGTSTSDVLLGNFTQQDIKPNDSVQASFSNETGCLTFYFHSDGNKEDPGWLAGIECFYPCQAFTVDVLYDGLPASTTPIKICQGTTVALNATGVYPYSAPLFAGATWSSPPFSQTVYADSLYHQEDDESEFKWKIKGENSDGAAQDDTEMGDDATHLFDEDGVYIVWVEVKDNHHQQPGIVSTKECFASNYIQQIYWVSTDPVFAGTAALDNAICNHTQNVVVGTAVPVSASYVVPPDTPDPTAIPDVGSTTGDFYSSPILQQLYTGDTILTPGDLQEVCIDIEHSAVGDIEVVITCPNGQTATLIAYDTSDNTDDQFLGEPVQDLENGAPGTPGHYCFKASMGQTIDDAAGTTGSLQTIPDGDYLPAEPFDSLVGCPVNGVWSISVKDHLDNDDGWVVGWDMTVSYPPSTASTFTPKLEYLSWTGTNSTATSFIDSVSVGNDTLYVTPHFPPGTTFPQTLNYRFTIQDTLNGVLCPYDTVVQFIVNEEAHPAFSYPNSPFCTNDPASQGMPAFTPPNVGGTFSQLATNPPGLVLNGSSGQIDPTSSSPGVYDVKNIVTTSNGCVDSSMVQITVKPTPVANAGPDISICPCDDVTLGGSYTIPAPGTGTTATYLWQVTPPSGGFSGTNDTVAVPGNMLCNIASSYTGHFVVTENGCTDSDDMLINTTTPNDASFSYPQSFYCKDVSSAFPVPVVGLGNMNVSPAGGLSIDLAGNPDTGEINPMASTPGFYTVQNTLQTNSLCPTDTATTMVEIRVLPLVDAGSDVSYCPGDIMSVPPTSNGSTSWSPADPNGLPATNPGLSPVTAQFTLTGTLNGCTAVDYVLITVLPAPVANAGLDRARCVDGPGQAIGTPSNTAGCNYSWNPCTNLSLCTGTNSAASGPIATPTVTTSYTVTVTSIDGCTATDQMVFKVNPLPTVSAGIDQTICEGYTAELIGAGALNYVWTPSGTGSTDQHYYVSPPNGVITYSVTGTDANGCSNTDQMTLTILEPPVASIGASVTYGYPPLNVVFNNNSTGATAYDWNLANGGTWYTVTDSSAQTSSYENPGQYVVYLNAYNGYCGDLDTVRITVVPYQHVDYYPPNVFTPDGNDTINAGWNLVVLNPENVGEYELDIFNRWGEKMFTLTSPTAMWNGQVNGNPAADGVYFYKYRILGLDKQEYLGDGFFELFRP